MFLKPSVATALVLGLVLALPALGQDPKAPSQVGKPPEGINKSFEHPDVKKYVERFETEDREVYAKRQEIVEAIGLAEGMNVADVGAGTGAFTQLFAEKVGPAGKVFAVDIAPEFLEHIAVESKKQGHKQVRTVKADQESTHLPKDSVDVIFLCDVYHHLEKPSLTLKSIREALKPSGRLVVVEFDRREGKSRDFILKHVRAGKDEFLKEIQLAGFIPTELKDPPKLKENFVAAFIKLDDSPEPTTPQPPKPKTKTNTKKRSRPSPETRN
jgi:ubiquinone/menaquinone biosynthesis C-methylase UbiE